jgi:hypothetical protein
MYHQFVQVLQFWQVVLTLFENFCMCMCYWKGVMVYWYSSFLQLQVKLFVQIFSKKLSYFDKRSLIRSLCCEEERWVCTFATSTGLTFAILDIHNVVKRVAINSFFFFLPNEEWLVHCNWILWSIQLVVLVEKQLPIPIFNRKSCPYDFFNVVPVLRQTNPQVRNE